ncbi:hypothetical protein GYB59_25360, partial [bacterium]|nr:hypothetical protein [bacterium]
MILTLTNSQDATADYLLPLLKKSGLAVVRINTDTLMAESSVSLLNGEVALTIHDQRLVPDDVKHLWYRRPERLQHVEFDDSTESRFAINEWSEAIEGFLAHIPKQRWMNHPSANVGASNKIEQLSTAQELGLRIPATVLTQDAATARKFAFQCDGNVIAKPLSNGYIERPSGDDSLIYTNLVKLADLDVDDSEFAACPTLFQQFVRKECDVRITVIDNAIHAVELRASGEDGGQRQGYRMKLALEMHDTVLGI